MNRYPLWVYVTIGVALVLGALYTLPNFFGEAPAVQVSPARATLKVAAAVLGRVGEALKKAGVQATGIALEVTSGEGRRARNGNPNEGAGLQQRRAQPDP